MLLEEHGPLGHPYQLPWGCNLCQLPWDVLHASALDTSLTTGKANATTVLAQGRLNALKAFQYLERQGTVQKARATPDQSQQCNPLQVCCFASFITSLFFLVLEPQHAAACCFHGCMAHTVMFDGMPDVISVCPYDCVKSTSSIFLRCFIKCCSTYKYSAWR